MLAAANADSVNRARPFRAAAMRCEESPGLARPISAAGSCSDCRHWTRSAILSGPTAENRCDITYRTWDTRERTGPWHPYSIPVSSRPFSNSISSRDPTWNRTGFQSASPPRCAAMSAFPRRVASAPMAIRPRCRDVSGRTPSLASRSWRSVSMGTGRTGSRKETKTSSSPSANSRRMRRSAP